MAKQIMLITGGAGGLGVACGNKLEEYKIVVTDYSDEIVEKAVADYQKKGMEAVGFTCDITSEDEVRELVEFTQKQGVLRGLVHTAGVSETVQNVEKIFDINLKGTALIVDAIYDIATEDTPIVLFSSMMGHTVSPNPDYDGALRNPLAEDSLEQVVKFVKDDSTLMYNFTKRGVRLIVEDNTHRFGSKGSRINSISPGVIMTKMGLKAAEEHPEIIEQLLQKTALQRTGDPDDIADVVKFLLSNDARFITGTDLIVDGGVLSSIKKQAE